jgi:hypothetical protein
MTISGSPEMPPAPPGFDIKGIRDKLAPLHDLTGAALPVPQFEEDIKPRMVGNLRQFTYPQKAGGQTVDGAGVTVSVTPDGRFYHIALSQVPQLLPPDAVRPSDDAVRFAKAQYLVAVAAEAVLQRRASILDASVNGGQVPSVPAELEGAGTSLIAVDGMIRRVHLVLVTAAVRDGGGSTLLDKREYAIDATTNDETAASVVRVLHLVAFSSGIARLFVPNPMRTLGTTNVSPLDVAALAPAYFPEELNDLDPPQNNAAFLTGPRVRIVEVEGPNLCPLNYANGFNTDLCLPNVPQESPAALADFTPFVRGTPEFAAAMAYFHVDRMQSYVTAALGLEVSPVSVDIAASKKRGFGHFVDCPSQKCPYGFIGLGRDGSNYLAEDATDIAHEYGHALLARGTNRIFGTHRTDQNGSEALPIGEGFGDYWSFSTFYALSKGTAFENCFGEWGNGYDCERHYNDKPTHSDFDASNDDHVNGMVWSGALADVFRKLGGRREVADAIILEGHYIAGRLPEAPNMVNVADAIVFAASTHAGVSAHELCDVFSQHGITPARCDPYAMRMSPWP